MAKPRHLDGHGRDSRASARTRHESCDRRERDHDLGAQPGSFPAGFQGRHFHRV